jgi:N-acetylglutamate synthase-like GNAT family acetyltransferase
MASSEFQIRRATLEDISALSALWQSMNYPVEELSRRITEFQVAVTPEGQLIGGIGLQILERQGLFHSEAFVDFALADAARAQLWDRLHVVAANYGLVRLWTRESAPFWNHCGLGAPDSEALEKLPALWRVGSGTWLTLKLREDVDAIMLADQQFAAFMATEKQRTQQVVERARSVRTFLNLFLLILAGVLFMAAVWLVMKNPHLIRR